jgi:hypothetical protein
MIAAIAPPAERPATKDAILRDGVLVAEAFD